MEPLLFVLAIMGCGDGAAQCTEARTVPTRYATMQQCQAAMPEALARSSDLSYPVISAACRGTRMQMASVADKRPG